MSANGKVTAIPLERAQAFAHYCALGRLDDFAAFAAFAGHEGLEADHDLDAWRTVFVDKYLAAARHEVTKTDAAVDKLRVLDVERMLTTPPPPVPWTVRPLLVAGNLTMIAGREGQGKSLFAQAVTSATGHGATVAGLHCNTGRVLYIDAENGEHEAHRRVHALNVKPGT